MWPILCLWIKVLSIVLRSTITFSFSHSRKKFRTLWKCKVLIISVQQSTTKKSVLTLHLPSYPLLLGRHLLHFEPFNGIKSNLRRIKSIQTHPGDEDRHHGKQIRGTNASKSGEPIQIRGETNWYKQLSFDILIQEHKDNTFWSIKQFFCHDMFSQRFSFPSWCFSLVMGKWFKGKSPGQSRGWHDRRGSVAVWARPNKKPQIASNCSERRKQRAISHASIFSHRLKYFYDLGEILSNRVPVIWEGESYQCRVICPRHVLFRQGAA